MGEIKIYENGEELLSENRSFLEKDPYASVFFFWDAPYLKETDHSNYGIRFGEGEKALLAMKVEPYNLLLFGHPDRVPETVDYLIKNGYEIRNYLCSSEIGDAVRDYLGRIYGINYYEALAMYFMEADRITEPSSEEVDTAVSGDLDEICECLEYFVRDCGLLDQVDREKTAKTLDHFRLIRVDGRIAAMAKYAPDTDRSVKITDVYTRDEFRGKHYARKVVNSLKNEIIKGGKIATLNVDKKNPVSSHLYESLGFRRVFSQGEYRPVPEEGR